MVESSKLYLHYIKVAIRSQMQYKASFIMMGIGTFVIVGIEFISIWAMFARFGNLKGWSLPEVALLYGIADVSFSIVEGFARGFDTFPEMVKSGDFDRFLLRPRSTALQVIGRDLQLMRSGRFLQGFIILIWAVTALTIKWTVMKVAILISAITGGFCIFTGIFIQHATLSFWTIESLEIVNTVTYGGVEATRYPLSIYRTWFQRFFTFIIPLAAINYYPVLAILGRNDPLGMPGVYHYISPIIGLIFLLISLRIWRFGVRHYCSTGS
jgi:ABC-2 type transport system permease protein